MDDEEEPPKPKKEKEPRKQKPKKPKKQGIPMSDDSNGSIDSQEDYGQQDTPSNYNKLNQRFEDDIYFTKPKPMMHHSNFKNMSKPPGN